MASAPADTAITSRRTVVSFADYRAAERAVDLLSDRGFPVEHVAIVGTGLRYVETVSGRRTTAGAAVNGAGQGVLYGLAWGLLFSLIFSLDSGSILGLIGYSVLLGLLFGAAIGALSHSARHDYSSAADTVADTYDVQVDNDFAGLAEQTLARMPAR